MRDHGPGPAAGVRIASWLLVFAYCAAIYWQSGAPAPRILPAWPGMDKAAHFFCYALLAVLFYRAWAATLPDRPGSSILAASIVSAAVYGLSDEIHQTFVPGRCAEFFDWAADTAGAAAGAFCWHATRRFARCRADSDH